MDRAILYLHGFCSSPESWKAKALEEALKHKSNSFFCPFLSHIPNEAISEAEAIIEKFSGEMTLVGSSLGGFYATWLAEKYDLNAALINPAVLTEISPSQFLGVQTNLYTGETFELTNEHIDMLRCLDQINITPARYLLMVETGDEVLDYRQAVRRYAGCRQIVIEGGNHSFSHFSEKIPLLLEFAGL